MTNILLIDNYDSFTYNLSHYLQELGASVNVVRNDMLSVDDVADMQNAGQIDGVVISPGPATPDEAGICLELVKTLGASLPILGVCLGHQSIAQAYGGKIIRAKTPMHGKVSSITHDGGSVFAGLHSPLTVTRYHSLIVEKESLPDYFTITSETEDGIIMGLEHKEHPLHGVQFHPESIASQHGHDMLKNFLNLLPSQ